MSGPDKRQNNRKPVALSATAHSQNQDWFSCTLRDASPTGCRIAIPPVAELDSSIEIAPRGFPGLIHGRVVWRKDGQAGVEFVKFVSDPRKPDADTSRQPADAAAGKTGTDAS